MNSEPSGEGGHRFQSLEIGMDREAAEPRLSREGYQFDGCVGWTFLLGMDQPGIEDAVLQQLREVLGALDAGAADQPSRRQRQVEFRALLPMGLKSESPLIAKPCCLMNLTLQLQ